MPIKTCRSRTLPRLDIRAGVRLTQVLQPRLDFRHHSVVGLDVARVAGQQESALRADGSGERILQLIDAVLARRGFLQAFAGLLQTRLPLSGHEKQRGEETDDEKRRHGDVPSSQAIQGVAQEVHAIHFVNNSIHCSGHRN